MEVGVIYQSIIDENDNFKIEFKKDQEIVELIFKKKQRLLFSKRYSFFKKYI